MIFMVTCLTCFSLTSFKKQEDAGKKKKNEITIRSSAAEYLTYVA